MKPNFIIAGCGKCGTTTLAYLLGQHPDVFICNPKEPNFLSYASIYAKGWQWYESLFESGKNKAARGEASVSYSLEKYEAKVAQRIAKYIPNVRIIYIARNPFQRLESVYREHHDSGYKQGWYLPYSLKEAVNYRPQMLTNSLYWQRTTQFRNILQKEQILYLCLEELIDDPDEVLKKCFNFIQVNPSLRIMESSQVRLNRGSQKRYDTRIMRFIRTHGIVNKIFEQLPQNLKQNLLIPILRKSFQDKKIRWDNSFRQYFIKEMSEDVQKYLKACGQAENFWGKEFEKQFIIKK